MSSASQKSSTRSATDLAATLGARLRAPYRNMQHQLYTQLATDFPEVRRAHSAVFRHISPEGSRLTDLAEQAEMTKQSMGYLVSHLCESGYLKTEAHPVDRRAQLVKLTSKGAKFLQAALEKSAELEKKAVAQLGASKVRQLRELLLELDQALVAPDR